jgi:PPP family 3-phenylpropionic acid transporter
MAAILPIWALFRAPATPLADALTVRALHGDRRGYGKIRAAGSVAFLIVAWTGGMLRPWEGRAPLWIGAALLTAAAALARSMPDPGPLPPRQRGDLRALWTAAAPFLGVSVLHGIALVGFDGYWSLHVARLGLPSWVAGTGVACAVAAEVVVLATGRTWLDRWGPTPVLFVSVVAGIPQWILASILTDPIPLIVVQSLRGLAFGAFWVAGVAWLSERTPPALASSAQALLPASSWGVGYLVCSAIAATQLRYGSTADLFRWFAVTEALAALLLVAAAARMRVRGWRGG